MPTLTNSDLVALLERLDLSTPDECLQLGHAMGSDLNQILIPTLHAIGNPELQIVFLCAFFASPHGAMTAAVGVEAAKGITDTLLNMGADVAEQKLKNAH